MDGADLLLTSEQKLVFQAVYNWFREYGTWPTFVSIDRPLRRAHGLDVRAVVHSLPDSLVVKPRRALPLAAEDELRLRLQGIHACHGGPEDTERFVRLLRWLAQVEMEFEPEPGSAQNMPRVTAKDARMYFGLEKDDRVALQRLYAMLQLDHWGLGGSGSGSDAYGWYMLLSADIWRFRNVQTVEDCIRARVQWKLEAEAAVLRIHNTVSQPAPLQSPGTYVDCRIIEAIQAKDGTSKLNVTKLLKLIEELNDNYHKKNTYAAHALLCAILDHIPPILDCVDFKAVANNYSWGRADKNYMKRLLDFRDQADDALHRQISTQADLLDFDDIPSSVHIDQLLQECADKLR